MWSSRWVSGLGDLLAQPGALGPTEIRRFPIPIPSYPRGTPTPEIAFTDSAGRRWLRLGTGQLKEIQRGDWKSEPKEDPGAYASEEDHPTLVSASTPPRNEVNGSSLRRPRRGWACLDLVDMGGPPSSVDSSRMGLTPRI